MSTDGNERLIAQVFDALSRGDARPLLSSMTDDVRWIVKGTTPWSRPYEGKAAVLQELLAPLNRRLDGGIRLTATRILATGDVVVAEARGEAVTRRGEPYRNEYCFLFTLREGRIVELTEYIDTQLIMRALDFEPEV